MDGYFVVHDVLYVFRTGMVVFYQNLQIENNAVIDAAMVLRAAAVECAVRNEDNVACMIGARIIVQRQMKVARDNADDFIVPVPVVRHVVSGTVRGFVIEGNRKVKRSLLPSLFVVKIFHISYTPSFFGRCSGILDCILIIGEYFSIFLYYMNIIAF